MPLGGGGGGFFMVRGCHFGGVYVPIIYSHPGENYHRRSGAVLLCYEFFRAPEHSLCLFSPLQF